MEQGQHYVYLNTAKQLSGTLRTEVNALRQSKCIAIKCTLKKEVTDIISNLRSSAAFLRSVGKVCEVDNMLIYYQSLLARLNSS